MSTLDICARGFPIYVKWLHPQKCIFGCPKVPYLGYVISAEGILPNPDKILAVKEFPTTTNVRAARESLGLASYYRRFVPDFAKEAGPLHMLTRANVPFVWTESCQEAFSYAVEGAPHTLITPSACLP